MTESDITQLNKSLSVLTSSELQLLLISIFNSGDADLNSYRDIINGIAVERIAEKKMSLDVHASHLKAQEEFLKTKQTTYNVKCVYDI